MPVLSRRAVLSIAGLAAGSFLACMHGSGDESIAAPDDAPLAPAPAGKAQGGLVAHEWGTFTSMQGSDGVSLDGLQHETESVPAFVHRNVQVEPSAYAVFGDTSRDVAAVRGVQSKMETPVIYFYSATERRVSVEVDFVGGLLTHWYPRYASASPEVKAAEREGVDMRQLAKSTMRWDVDLLPPEKARSTERDGSSPSTSVPAVDADDAWQLARETRAAVLRTAPAGEAAQSKSTEAEHYIFYRGLGRVELPLSVISARGGMTIVRNLGQSPIPAAFVLEMRESEGRFMRMPKLPVAAGQPAPMSGVALRPKAEVLASLETEVHAALVAEGLFEDEARAMVRTWSRAWFASEGTRVLYLIPRDVIDRVLPLRIEPRPETLVRVLVGRHEFLTPEKEEEVERLLKDRRSQNPIKAKAAMAELGRIGRFLEPAVRRAIAHSTDEAVRKSGLELLAASGR